MSTLEEGIIIEQKPVVVEQGINTPKDDVLCDCCKRDHRQIRMAVIRKSPHMMFQDVAKWFNGLGAKEVLSHNQTESNGNITLTVFYR